MGLGHIQVAISGTTYDFLTDINSVQEVDIVDFAPRAIAGTPAWSELGLYLDVGQDNFGHGFGSWTFSEPASYAFSGHQVDTRHGGAGLFTQYTEEQIASGIWNKLINHRGVLVACSSAGLYVKKPSDSTWVRIVGCDVVSDLLDTGNFVLGSWTGQLTLLDAGAATSGATSTITLSGAGWTVNCFAGGTITIFDGPGILDSFTVVSNTADTITISGAWSATPTTASYFVVWDVTGNAGNTPLNFQKFATFGGYYWANEKDTNFLHFWTTPDGSTAEGHGTTDAAVIQVGPLGGKIKNMVPFENQLWVFREDGAWTVAEDNLAYHTLVSFAELSHPSNFMAVAVWNGFLVFPVRNTLYKYKSGLQDITPPVWNEDAPYKQFGDFASLIVRGKYIYTLARSNAAYSGEALETTTGFVSLMASDGVGWHKLMDIPIAAPTSFRMWLDQVNNVIYIFAENTGDGTKLYTVQLQTYSDLPYDSYPTGGSRYLYTSYYDLGYKRIYKSFASLTINADYPSAATTIIVSYRMDNTLTWTTLGTFDTDMEEIAISATGKRIQFRINLVTSNASYSPYLKALIMKLMIRPDVLYGVTMDIVVSPNLMTADNRRMNQSAEAIRTALKAARASVAPITLTAMHGTSASAYLTSLRFITVQYIDSNEIEEIARCTFVYV